MEMATIKAVPENDESDMKSSLWKRAGELAASSAFLLYLAEAGSQRLSQARSAFFMLAASADAAGKPATYSDIVEMTGGIMLGLKNSYRQLLEPSRPYPDALGWLKAVENPMDAREKVLRLTERGEAVVEGALIALKPIKLKGIPS